MFQDNGFTLYRSKKHLIWQCPCGHTQVVSASSPCKGRGDTNARLQIQRTLRACATPQEDTAA